MKKTLLFLLAVGAGGASLYPKVVEEGLGRSARFSTLGSLSFKDAFCDIKIHEQESIWGNNKIYSYISPYKPDDAGCVPGVRIVSYPSRFEKICSLFESRGRGGKLRCIGFYMCFLDLLGKTLGYSEKIPKNLGVAGFLLWCASMSMHNLKVNKTKSRSIEIFNEQDKEYRSAGRGGFLPVISAAAKAEADNLSPYYDHTKACHKIISSYLKADS